MGVDYTVYVGPYVECENREVSKVETHEGCPKCKKSLQMSGGNYPPKQHNFCPKCGTARGTYSKSRMVKLVDYEELEEANVYNDWRVRSSYDLNRNDDDLREIMLPNLGLPEGHILEFDRREGPAGVFDIPNREEVLAVFEADYAEEIATLRKLYGDDKSKVQFGVVAYYS